MSVCAIVCESECVGVCGYFRACVCVCVVTYMCVHTCVFVRVCVLECVCGDLSEFVRV